MGSYSGDGSGKKPALDLHESGIPHEEIGVIQQAISEMSDDPAIEAIYLYGSYAQSRQKPYSDIDLAVITRSSIPLRTEKERIGSYSSKKCDVQVFSDLPLPARMQVLSQGIPLFVRSPEFINRLIRSVSLSYMDQEPMRDRFKKRILRQGYDIN